MQFLFVVCDEKRKILRWKIHQSRASRLYGCMPGFFEGKIRRQSHGQEVCFMQTIQKNFLKKSKIRCRFLIFPDLLITNDQKKSAGASESKGELSLIKTVNLAYQEPADSLSEKSTAVIQVHTNERLLKEREMLEQPAVPEDKPVYECVKRTADIVCATAGLVVLSPVFLAVMTAIVVNDPGNPFFVQTRIGKDGKEFRIYKFRSMYRNAEKQLVALQKRNESKGATFKMKDDPRVTSVGRFIRKTSIDELPQLVNILKGDMSVIGPRPFIPSEQENLPPDRLLVKPGLSCYWQIGGKNELPLAEQISLDRNYIRERSLWTDFKIFCKTIVHVISRKNC